MCLCVFHILYQSFLSLGLETEFLLSSTWVSSCSYQITGDYTEAGEIRFVEPFSSDTVYAYLWCLSSTSDYLQKCLYAKGKILIILVALLSTFFYLINADNKNTSTCPYLLKVFVIFGSFGDFFYQFRFGSDFPYQAPECYLIHKR